MRYEIQREGSRITVFAVQDNIVVGEYTIDQRLEHTSGHVDDEMRRLASMPSLPKIASKRRVKHQSHAGKQAKAHEQGKKVKPHGYVHKPKKPKQGMVSEDLERAYMASLIEQGVPISGRPLKLAATTPELTPEMQRQFTYGACGGLAIALHDATGWPLVMVTDAENVTGGLAHMGASGIHWLVRRPDGMLVDVDGVHRPEDVLTRYEDESDWGEGEALGEASREDAVEEYEAKGEPVPLEVCAQYAAAVLATVKQAARLAATTPEFMEQYMQAHGPWSYHAVLPEGLPDGKTEMDVLKSIKQNGILPRSQTGFAPEWENQLQSRPDHVYLANHQYAREMTGDDRHPQFAIDLRRIDPKYIDADEDHVMHAIQNREQLPDIHHVHPVTWDDYQTSLPAGGFKDLGEWADHHSQIIDTPDWTNHSMGKGSFAVKGGIPPEAIRINPAWAARNQPKVQQMTTHASTETVRRYLTNGMIHESDGEVWEFRNPYISQGAFGIDDGTPMYEMYRNGQRDGALQVAAVNRYVEDGRLKPIPDIPEQVNADEPDLGWGQLRHEHSPVKRTFPGPVQERLEQSPIKRQGAWQRLTGWLKR